MRKYTVIFALLLLSQYSICNEGQATISTTQEKPVLTHQNIIDGNTHTQTAAQHNQSNQGPIHTSTQKAPLIQPLVQKVDTQIEKLNEVNNDATRSDHTQKQLLEEGFENGEDISFVVNPLDENIMENEQKQIQQKQVQKIEKKVHEWVAKEFQGLSEVDSIQTHEIFAFQIQDHLDFKWNPSEKVQTPLRFVIEIFNYERGDITYPDNPEEDDFIEVSTQSNNGKSFANLGKVYIKAIFTINYFADYQIIRLVNRYPKTMLIQISLQTTKFVPQAGLIDDSLKIPAQKIKTILLQLEQTEMKREKTYKSQWSFRDREEHHQSEMLILTGVELIVILATAVVQMFCIKNLFDNRLIV